MLQIEHEEQRTAKSSAFAVNLLCLFPSAYVHTLASTTTIAGIEGEIEMLRRYAVYLQGVMSAASEGLGGVAESFETVDDVLGRCACAQVVWRKVGGLPRESGAPTSPTHSQV